MSSVCLLISYIWDEIPTLRQTRHHYHSPQDNCITSFDHLMLDHLKSIRGTHLDPMSVYDAVNMGVHLSWKNSMMRGPTLGSSSWTSALHHHHAWTPLLEARHFHLPVDLQLLDGRDTAGQAGWNHITHTRHQHRDPKDASFPCCSCPSILTTAPQWAQLSTSQSLQMTLECSTLEFSDKCCKTAPLPHLVEIVSHYVT